MARGKDLAGYRFGRLTVIGKTEKKQDRYVVWRCRCDCGGEIEVNTKRLTRGTVTNCGCVPKTTVRNGPIAEDLRGRVFGDLTVFEQAESNTGRACWRCRCSCGNETIVTARNLKAGKTRSCGCRKYIRNSQHEDPTGRRFGRLTVLYENGQRDDRFMSLWHCRCDCGTELDVAESALVYGNCKSCGCLKREVWQNIPNQLHRIDGTCVEWLEKRKHRSDNTNGFRGVYHMKNGKYRVTLGFKGKRYSLGTYKDYNEAVNVRLEAEKQVHERFVQAYYVWQNEMGQELLIFDVEMVNGNFRIITNVNV